MGKVLTDRGIRGLKPKPGKRVQEFDSVVPGFAVRVTENGVKSFVVVTRVNGKQRWVTLGRVGVVDLVDARDAARDVVLKAKKGEDPVARRGGAAQRPDTVLRVVALFMFRQGRKNRSRWEALRIYRRYVLGAQTGTDGRLWKDRLIAEIGQRDIVDLLEGLAGTPYMANRVLSAVRLLFNWAAARSIVDGVPVFKKLAAEEHSRDRVLSDDEIKGLWSAANVYPFGPALRLMLSTGARRSEIFGASWSEIDLDRKAWTIPAVRAKNGVRHELPLSDLAVEVLKSLPRQSGPYVFSTTAGEKPYRGYSKAKADIASKVAFADGWRMHDLRRTVGSGLQALRFSSDIIGAVLNHAKGGGATPIYMRYDYAEEKREALGAWGRRLKTIIGEEPGNVVELRG